MKLTLLLFIAIVLVLFLAVICRAEEIQWDKLIACVIEIESGGNPNAVSNRGAIGICQITPIVLKEYNQYAHERYYETTISMAVQKYTLDDLFSIDINYHIAEWYLHRLHDHYNCDTIEKILMAYNAGITRCKKVDFDIKKLPKETQRYVVKVMKLYQETK